MEKKKLSRRGWNWYAFFFNILWYFKYGIVDKAIIMTVLAIFSLGIGIIPVAIYSGVRGNQDRYKESLKKITL